MCSHTYTDMALGIMPLVTAARIMYKQVSLCSLKCNISQEGIVSQIVFWRIQAKITKWINHLIESYNYSGLTHLLNIYG